MTNFNRLKQLNRRNKEYQSPLQHRFYPIVAIDVDSCLTNLEGIDLLAEMSGVGKIVTKITNNTMGGGIPFNVALTKRLELIKPNKHNLDIVSTIYIKKRIKDARLVIKLLQKNKVNILLLSGGFKLSIIPLAKYVGIAEKNVYANELIFDAEGKYLGFDGKNLLSQEGGKRKQIENLKKGKKDLFAIVGDGFSELATVPVTNFMIGFGAFVSRQRVVEEADVFLSEPTFIPLILLLLDPLRIRKIFYEPGNREILIKAFDSMNGVKFNNRAKLLQKSIMKLYKEFIFYTKNIRL